MFQDEKIQEEEVVKGDPWSVIPIKTSKYAKECIEIVLSKRKITELVNFESFKNLEALWLTNNCLTSINGLDENFRIKILCCAHNRITTLEGSISCMKFLETLYLNDNKLKNLDKCLTYLKRFSFLKNLNLFNNPIAEEPEYRPRVIDALKSLKIFDRHMITTIERIKDEQIVREFNDPLNKKIVKKDKRKKNLKVYENFSNLEKDLIRETKQIEKERKIKGEEKKKIDEEVVNREKYPNGYIPYNKIMYSNFEKYYDKKQVLCPELEDNETDRLFNKYDRANTGKIKKEDIQMLFFDIKDLLQNRGVEFNENKLINHMLNFYAQSGELVTKDDIKKCYGKILHQYKSNLLKENVVISNLDYLKKIAMENVKEDNNKVNKNVNVGPQRRDIFNIKCITDKEKREIILNENKLKKV